MAQMSPPGLGPRAWSVSDAERAVYRELERQLPSDWLVLHSLWLRNHLRKAHAEIDFVVFGESAVLLLEVKGGIVTRDAQGWHFRPRHGGPGHSSNEGPFDQVRGAYYAMREHLESLNKADLFFNYVWGYAVITPDCIPKIPTSDTQIQPELLLDLSGFPQGLREFLDEAGSWWRERCLSIKRAAGRSESSLNQTVPAQVRRQLFSLFRPDFECIRSIGTQVKEADAEICRLTEEQYRALDYAALNPRLLLIGGAGTGKTLLAFEQARRKAVSGAKVLLTCFNRLLADHLRKLAVEAPEMAGIEVANYHQLVGSLLREAGLHDQMPENWNSFNAKAPELVYQAVDCLGIFERYDYLVMDEGQDLMSRGFIEVLDLLLKNQTANGEWLICVDQAQTIFGSQFDQQTYDSLLNLNYKISLPVNCRNTRQVASYVKGLTDAGEMPRIGADEPQVTIEYYKDFDEFLRTIRKTVNRLVGEFEKVELAISEVVILSTDLAFISEITRAPGFFVRPVQEASAEPAPGAIQVSTVQAFKGLEAAAVILVGLNSLDSDIARGHLYVGGSRARSILTICLPSSCATYVQACLPKILAALAASG